MAVNCQACADLRESSTEFITNGVTDSVCTSLKNDTGFNPSADPVHNDCEDLDAANDCLVGNMEDELEAYEVCDWKQFMKRFIPNAHAVIKSIICAVCGIWKRIHDIEEKLGVTTTFWCSNFSDEEGEETVMLPPSSQEYPFTYINLDIPENPTYKESKGPWELSNGALVAPYDGYVLINTAIRSMLTTADAQLGIYIYVNGAELISSWNNCAYSDFAYVYQNVTTPVKVLHVNKGDVISLKFRYRCEAQIGYEPGAARGRQTAVSIYYISYDE